jgi:hypothetical protein
MTIDKIAHEIDQMYSAEFCDTSLEDEIKPLLHQLETEVRADEQKHAFDIAKDYILEKKVGSGMQKIVHESMYKFLLSEPEDNQQSNKKE